MSAEHQYYTSSHCFYCGEQIVSTTDAREARQGDKDMNDVMIKTPADHPVILA